jgi:hypothetical protein
MAGGQGRRMADLDVRQGPSLPGVKMNSKNGLGELKNSEPGSGSVHGEKLASPMQKAISNSIC